MCQPPTAAVTLRGATSTRAHLLQNLDLTGFNRTAAADQ